MNMLILNEPAVIIVTYPPTHISCMVDTEICDAGRMSFMLKRKKKAQ